MLNERHYHGMSFWGGSFISEIQNVLSSNNILKINSSVSRSASNCQDWGHQHCFSPSSAGMRYFLASSYRISTHFKALRSRIIFEDYLLLQNRACSKRVHINEEYKFHTISKVTTPLVICGRTINFFMWIRICNLKKNLIRKRWIRVKRTYKLYIFTWKFQLLLFSQFYVFFRIKYKFILHMKNIHMLIHKTIHTFSYGLVFF